MANRKPIMPQLLLKGRLSSAQGPAVARGPVADPAIGSPLNKLPSFARRPEGRAGAVIGVIGRAPASVTSVPVESLPHRSSRLLVDHFRESTPYARLIAS